MDSKARILEAFQFEQMKVAELEEKLKAADYANKVSLISIIIILVQ